jgi:hypothetical protein
MDANSMDDAPFDPTRRKLCADGACVGVIGADGRCGECGRTEAEAEAGAEPVAAGGSVIEAEVVTAPTDADGGGFDSKRRLCDDGGCVGVVGDDGACRVCGRRSQ